MELSTIHILESGDHHHFMQTLFERIHLLWTYRQPPKSCLAALVSNYAAIARHQPQEDGVHAIYYARGGGGLSRRAIESALFDKDRLRRIAVGGRAHVRANHAGPASCERVLRATLQDEVLYRDDRPAISGTTDAVL
jgi:hypothetical protein